MLLPFLECNYCRHYAIIGGKDYCLLNNPWVQTLTNEIILGRKKVCEDCEFTDGIQNIVKDMTRKGLIPKNRYRQ